MTRPAAKGKTLWPALVAAAALLLTAPQALASRTASSRADLLTSPALDQVPATAHALAPAYVPQGFPLHLDADPHPAAFALFDDLTPTPASERLEPEKLASGVESWVLTPNLQRLQIFVTDSRWCREFLGAVDSPNLYQAFGLDPQNNTDPLGLQVPSTAQVADALDKGVDELTKLLCKGDAACLAVNARTNVVVKGSYDALRLFNDFDEQLDASLHGDSQRAYRLAASDVFRATDLALTLGPPAAKALSVARQGRQVARAAKVPGELVFSEHLPGSPSVAATAPKPVPEPVPLAPTVEAAADSKIVLRYSRNPAHPADEFARQAGIQGQALSGRTAGEIRATIERVRAEGRLPEADRAVAAARRANPAEARGNAALHPADSCIGGDPTKICGFGDKAINSALGRQNRNLQPYVYDVVRDLPPEAKVPVVVIIQERSR